MTPTEPAEPAPPDESAPRDGRREQDAFPVVAIGASAGGLEAVRELLAHLPADTGMAFVLVQHLDPNHESKLVELLGRPARFPVVEASYGLELRPDHLYI